MDTTIITTDERKGLPSASSYQRYISCEASLPLVTTMKRNGTLPVDMGTDIARAGDEIHELCQKILQKTVTEEDRRKQGFEEAEELIEILMKQVEIVFGDITDGDRYLIWIEERFWLLDDGGEPISSGRFDFICYDLVENIGFVADFKTGWNDVEKGRKNAQLAGGAILLSKVQTNMESCYVVIIETHAKIVLEELTKTEISIWELKIVNRLRAKDKNPLTLAYNPTADNCRYCEARLGCPMMNYVLGEASATSITRVMENRALEELADKLSILSALKAAVESEMEYRITMQGVRFERWTFAGSAGKRKFSDAATACNVLLGLGATPTRVFQDVGLPIGKAEAIHKQATGLKGKAAAADFDAKLGPYIVREGGAPSIKKI